MLNLRCVSYVSGNGALFRKVQFFATYFRLPQGVQVRANHILTNLTYVDDIALYSIHAEAVQDSLNNFDR